MSEEEALQRKKDALWEVHQANQHATHLKQKITALLTSASKAARGWDESFLWVNEDGSMIANYADNSLDADIEFDGSDVLKALLKELAETEHTLSEARKAFDALS